jgi:hypothetical protein
MQELRQKMPAAGLLAAVLVVLAGPARAETWCIRDAGSPGPGACVFPSSQECGTAARLNPFGGICERQPLGWQRGQGRLGAPRGQAQGCRPLTTHHGPRSVA